MIAECCKVQYQIWNNDKSKVEQFLMKRLCKEAELELVK